MRVFSDFIKTLSGMTGDQINAVVILAAFGLAAFAIYVVFKIARERGK